MARKYTESELLHFIELYLDGNSHQSLVKKYNLKLSSTQAKLDSAIIAR